MAMMLSGRSSWMMAITQISTPIRITALNTKETSTAVTLGPSVSTQNYFDRGENDEFSTRLYNKLGHLRKCPLNSLTPMSTIWSLLSVTDDCERSISTTMRISAWVTMQKVDCWFFCHIQYFELNWLLGLLRKRWIRFSFGNGGYCHLQWNLLMAMI